MEWKALLDSRGKGGPSNRNPMAAQPPPPSVTQSEPDSAVAVGGCRVLWPGLGDGTPTHFAVLHLIPTGCPGQPAATQILRPVTQTHPPRTPTRASHPALSSERSMERQSN